MASTSNSALALSPDSSSLLAMSMERWVDRGVCVYKGERRKNERETDRELNECSFCCFLYLLNQTLSLFSLSLSTFSHVQVCHFVDSLLKLNEREMGGWDVIMYVCLYVCIVLAIRPIRAILIRQYSYHTHTWKGSEYD